MSKVKDLEKRLMNGSDDPSKAILKEVVKAMCLEEKLNMAILYELPLEDFQLAIDTLKRWRLDRYTKTRDRIMELVSMPGENS